MDLQAVSQAIQSPAGIATQYSSIGVAMLGGVWGILKAFMGIKEEVVLIKTQATDHYKEDDRRFEDVNEQMVAHGHTVGMFHQTVTAEGNRIVTLVGEMMHKHEMRVEDVEGHLGAVNKRIDDVLMNHPGRRQHDRRP